MDIMRIVLGLLAAAVVYLVGTAITSFENENLIWGLVAVVVFLAVFLGDGLRGRRL
jgi:hypothetical protein